MREIRTLRATWRGLETWCGSGPPGHNDAPALDPTCGNRGRATASGDPVGWETERCRMAQATAPILDSTEPDMPQQSLYLRCRGQSERHLLAASISHFDPMRTWLRPRWLPIPTVFAYLFCAGSSSVSNSNGDGAQRRERRGICHNNP